MRLCYPRTRSAGGRQVKPSKRDIIEWARTVWPGVFRGPDPLYNGYVEFAELAYAAGRKAGMEEAQWACKRLAVRHAGTQRGQGAQECIGEIDAAMEADK